jgi:hypothetical protein
MMEKETVLSGIHFYFLYYITSVNANIDFE